MENLTNDTPPKKGFWTPPRTVRFPPPSGVSTLFFLYKNPRQSRPEALLEGSKYFRESAFSGTFSSPHTFCTPPYHGPIKGECERCFRASGVRVPKQSLARCEPVCLGCFARCETGFARCETLFWDSRPRETKSLLALSLPYPSFPCFFWKTARKTTQKSRIFYPYRTPKIPGKEAKNAKKKQGNPHKGKKTRNSKKTRKGRTGLSTFGHFDCFGTCTRPAGFATLPLYPDCRQTLLLRVMISIGDTELCCQKNESPLQRDLRECWQKSSHYKYRFSLLEFQ